MKFKIKNFFLLIIFFSNSSVLLSNEDYVLIPKNILDVRSGSLIEGNIHIKDGIIVAINQKLSNDIRSLERVVFVMKNGKIYKNL